jgi:cyclase
MTVGGGIRSVEDATEILRSGADKVAINTAAVANPALITQLAEKFGSQCVVLSIEAKKNANGHWEVLTENGRERSGLDVVEWAIQGCSNGAGEILLTSVDMEGTKKGFDNELLKAVSSQVEIPVIASGGMGKLSDAVDAIEKGEANAVAMADILHYGKATFSEVREELKVNGISVRNYEFS